MSDLRPNPTRQSSTEAVEEGLVEASCQSLREALDVVRTAIHALNTELGHVQIVTMREGATRTAAQEQLVQDAWSMVSAQRRLSS